MQPGHLTTAVLFQGVFGAVTWMLVHAALSGAATPPATVVMFSASLRPAAPFLRAGLVAALIASYATLTLCSLSEPALHPVTSKRALPGAPPAGPAARGVRLTGEGGGELVTSGRHA